MKNLLLLLTAAVVCLTSCRHSSSARNALIDRAAMIAAQHPDSALEMLRVIDPAELSVDSLRAKYHYVVALAHERQGSLMLADSLISFSAGFYRDKDPRRAIESATLLALYEHLTGRRSQAISHLDSLTALPGVPDSLLIFPLRRRAYLGDKIYDDTSNRPNILRLISIDGDSLHHDQYRYWLYIDYLFAGQSDSALAVLDGLIAQAVLQRSDSDRFRYEYEKIGVLEELGRYSESLELADKFISQSPGNSILHYLHLWKSLAHFNMGHIGQAVRELERADSCASVISDAEKGYYNSFASVLNTAFDLHRSGKLRLIRVAQVSNTWKDEFFRTSLLREESQRSALELENKRILLKARSDRQAALIIIIVLAALLLCGLSLWYAFARRRRSIEAEERAEALAGMVEELKAPASQPDSQNTLRRTMLRQLGIIKMLSETPTEQNREMLRKISSIDNATDGALVNWENLFEIIDNLYSGFYTRLHTRYEGVLTDREEQIIVLMMAGFSTKEIGVITAQTAATVYVRKSSVRKKLGLSPKQDIVAFLTHELSC